MGNFPLPRLVSRGESASIVGNKPLKPQKMLKETELNSGSYG